MHALPDTQASHDVRGIALDAAGIRGLRLPIRVQDTDGTEQHTIAVADASVPVGGHQRGTHMSRLVEHMQGLSGALRLRDLASAAASMARRLDSDQARIELRFPWFVGKSAPVTGVPAHVDVDASYTVAADRGGAATITQMLTVPVTSLCPCSKAISRYGAHNQRSRIGVRLEVRQPIAIAFLTQAIEACASGTLYSVLKRPDEKFVTEYAYENAKFAEDIVRDVAERLSALPECCLLSVVSENMESIHNHSAYASIGDAGPSGGLVLA